MLITIGRPKMVYNVLATDIEHNIILAMDLISSYGFTGSKVRLTENVKLNHRKNKTVKAILTEDIEIGGRSETFNEI